uniref:SPFH domain-containing protein n=1 Tax=Streptomyces sp. NRRL B-1347 TaxID=1476877 RepID=UPI0004CAE204
MLEELLAAGVATVSACLLYAASAARVVKQYERGVVFRLGRLHGEARPPGFTMVVPGVDRMRKVNMQIVTMPVPAQEGITRDNVTVRVDAVVYFKVLRSIIGKSDLDDLLSNR